MSKLSVKDLQVAGKKVLMRVDFNVPLNANSTISDATRIEETLPSIRYLLDRGASLILMAHLGNPRGMPNPRMSLQPCAKFLRGLLAIDIQMAPDCIGHKVRELVDKLQPKQVLLLENMRFHRAEEHPDEDRDFAKQLAAYGDYYVNDAFGSAHRKHSSTYTVASYFPGRAAAGFLMEKEINTLTDLLLNPKRPFYALIGGAKVSSKIGIIKALTKHVDALCIGGGMSYTFLKAMGVEIGNSLCEEEMIPIAIEIIDLCKKRNMRLLFPVDAVVAKEDSSDACVQVVALDKGIPKGFQGLDIGTKSIAQFKDALKNAKTIFWNGPLGVFEIEKFAHGTKEMAQALADSSAITVVGGGDSIAALNRMDIISKITYVSTGGGATLEFLEFGTLPAIEVLSEAGTISKTRPT